MDSPEALQILFESPPPNGTVVVIDDEPRLLRTLEDVVHKAGYKSCAFQNTEDFRRSRSGLNSEVFSIDWEIGTGKRRHVGPQLISWARQSSSHGACFVYTKHDVQRSAQQCGADFFVSKLTGTETANFRKAIVDGVRLSWARRIRDALKEMGQHSDVPDLAFGSWIDFKQEIAVCSISRQSALRAYLDGATHLGFLKLGLTDVLISRGWWSAFDVVAYSRMSLLEKLQQLALFAGMMLPTLAKIIAAGNVFLDTMNARKN